MIATLLLLGRLFLVGHFALVARHASEARRADPDWRPPRGYFFVRPSRREVLVYSAFQMVADVVLFTLSFMVPLT